MFADVQLPLAALKHTLQSVMKEDDLEKLP